MTSFRTLGSQFAQTKLSLIPGFLTLTGTSKVHKHDLLTDSEMLRVLNSNLSGGDRALVHLLAYTGDRGSNSTGLISRISRLRAASWCCTSRARPNSKRMIE